ncbi:hypothetical protein [Runella sp. SP2]|uniref:hypothetical protein n=1 Tax=Runella sp. SP2 TaxID=2268026 RepID=UPI000F08F7C4|nr:hypothetical protein [Runella sp. SP2]AYQ31379.1 hypothetical protein DTQ70_03940 [Runella sp. SP2]
MPSQLPPCGPCGPQWTISFVKHKEGSIYTVGFHGANVTRILWDVEQGCKDLASGQEDPQTNTFEINVNGVSDGKAYLKASCPTCEGYCNPFQFDVVHNSSNTGNEEEVTSIDNDANIEANTDHNNINLKIKINNGVGSYDATVKNRGITVYNEQVQYGSSYLEITFPSFFGNIDLRGNTLTIVLTQGNNTINVEYFVPKLVFREYTPDYENNADDRLLMLRLRKSFLGEYHIEDYGETRGLNPEYFIDGGNGGDCDILPDVGYPVEKRIEILKVLVPTVSARWLIGGNYTIAVNIFWIQIRPWGNMPANAQKGLWFDSEAIGKPRMLSDATTFELPPTKKYNRAFSGKLEGVSDSELQRVSWANSSSDMPLWLYAPQIIDIIDGMGVTQSEGGVHTWAAGSVRLTQFSEAMLAALGNRNVIITDWEGNETETPTHSWKWSNAANGAANIKWIQDYLAARGKQYYDWFQNTGFDFDNKRYSLVSNDGTFSYISHRPNNGQQYFHTAADWETLWANLSSVTLPNVDSGRVGLGYNNVTAYAEESYSKPPKRRYHSMPHILFAQMVCNFYSRKLPNAKLLSIQWPCEDQRDRRSITTHRFRPSPELGYVRGRDMRYVYSQNLYEDFTLFMFLSGNVHLQHIWNTNDNIFPYSALYYASRNFQPKCSPEGPFVYNYEGSENYACPANPSTYIGMEAQIFEALISSGEIYAQKYKHICDGANNQLDLNNSFQYRRGKVGSWITVPASVGDEHLQAWKYDQPYLTIWHNTTNNARVIYFQDLFSKPYEDVEFRLTINGSQYTHIAKGNRAFHTAYN